MKRIAKDLDDEEQEEIDNISDHYQSKKKSSHQNLNSFTSLIN